MEPFFAQTGFGQDCDMSLVGLYAFGGIVLAVAVGALVLHVLTIPEPETPLFTVVRVAQSVELMAGIAIIHTAWTAPTHTYIPITLFSMLFMANGSLWSYLGYQTVVKTVVKVRLAKHVNTVSFDG